MNFWPLLKHSRIEDITLGGKTRFNSTSQLIDTDKSMPNLSAGLQRWSLKKFSSITNSQCLWIYCFFFFQLLVHVIEIHFNSFLAWMRSKLLNLVILVLLNLVWQHLYSYLSKLCLKIILLQVVQWFLKLLLFFCSWIYPPNTCQSKSLVESLANNPLLLHPHHRDSLSDCFAHLFSMLWSQTASSTFPFNLSMNRQPGAVNSIAQSRASSTSVHTSDR